MSLRGKAQCALIVGQISAQRARNLPYVAAIKIPAHLLATTVRHIQQSRGRRERERETKRRVKWRLKKCG